VTAKYDYGRPSVGRRHGPPLAALKAIQACPLRPLAGRHARGTASRDGTSRCGRSLESRGPGEIGSPGAVSCPLSPVDATAASQARLNGLSTGRRGEETGGGRATRCVGKVVGSDVTLHTVMGAGYCNGSLSIYLLSHRSVTGPCFGRTVYGINALSIHLRWRH